MPYGKRGPVTKKVMGKKKKKAKKKKRAKKSMGYGY